MAQPKLEVRSLVRAQAAGEPPPPPHYNGAYALVYDGVKKSLLYLRESDDNEYGNALAFSGGNWRPFSKAHFSAIGGNVRSTFFDASRKGIAVWAYEYSSDTHRHEVRGMLLANDTATPIETRGDPPKIADNDRKSMIVGFDVRREVTVCLTPEGLWELSANGAELRAGVQRAELRAGVQKASWSQVYTGDPIPNPWTHQTRSAAYDTKSNRLVFFVNGNVFLAWNGVELERIEAGALPPRHKSSLDYAIASHPKHGLVVHAGVAHLFALHGDRWTPLEDVSGSPPACGFAQMAYDAAEDALVLGPGSYESWGCAYQHVFFILRNGKWEQQGRIINRVLSQSGSSGWLNEWFFIDHGMQTHAYRDGKWVEVLSKEVAQKQVPDEWPLPWTGQLVGDEIWVLTGKGRIVGFNGKSARTVSKCPPKYGHRVAPEVCFDPLRSRYVLWGGINRSNGATNDTFIFDGKKWIVPKTPSPQPDNLKDLSRGCAGTANVTTFFDSALAAVVRLTPEGAVVLIDETWKPFVMKGGAKVGAVFHDLRTQQTLILVDDTLWRFDLDRLQEVATLGLDDSRGLPKCREMMHTCFDPDGRVLHIQDHGDVDGRWAVDLSPAFERATTLGPRTIPAELTAIAASKR